LWGGHDRVPALFGRWVTHRSGPFFVAEVGGRVVGMGKLTLVTAREAWLEGGRVAPRWRRKGLATALIAYRLGYAREGGFAIVRFSTASDNTPIHRAARRFGFRRVRAYVRYEAPAREGVGPRRARSGDAAAVLRLLDPYVRVDRGWEWRALTPEDVREAIANGRAFVAGEGAARAAVVVSRAHDASLPIVAVGGEGAPLRALLRGLRAEAARRGLSEVGVYAAGAAVRSAARGAGYARPWDGGAYLYEKRFRRAAGSPRARSTSRPNTARGT
jgi:ribosomal protein S18 acetylase RimI-like enzyme